MHASAVECTKKIKEYQFVENITVFASGKDGIFNAGTPIGKTTEEGEATSEKAESSDKKEESSDGDASAES